MPGDNSADLLPREATRGRGNTFISAAAARPAWLVCAVLGLAIAGPAMAQAPTAVDDNTGTGLAAITEGGSISGTYNVLDNDTNPTANPMAATLVGGPSNAASFTLNTNGTFNYTHNATQTASDSFTYQADNGAVSNTATVTITINNTNDAPVLTRTGAAVINLGTGDPFVDPGATATDEEDGNLTGSIVVGGDAVNINQPGSYVITYNVTDSGGLPAPEVTRTVNVTDDVPPVITLTGATTINLAAGAPYSEPGYSAIDNVDGVITGNVVVGGDVVNTSVAGTYVVTYNVSDAAGNPAVQRTRTINVAANNAPVITLLGAASITINQGDAWSDPGATASDTEDGNLTGSIVVGGDVVDPNTAGVYVITYDVTDSLGNPAVQKTRTVTVLAPPPEITGQVALSTPEDTALLLQVGNFTVNQPGGILTLIVQDGTNYTHVGNTITPALNFNGTLTVPVIVNNGVDDSAVFPAQVTVTPVNDAPVITGQQALAIDEDTSLTLVPSNISVTDPDSAGPFTPTILDGPNYTHTGNTITPAPNYSGTLSVGITVSDGQATSPPFGLVVTVRPVNDAPMLATEIPDQVGVEMSAFNLDISGNFSDADGDNLSYTASGLPPSGNITFNTNTGRFGGTPQLQDARDNDPYIVTVTASDGKAGSTAASDTFNLTISALDRANVSLEIGAAPDPGMLNDQLRWTFNVRNSVGPQAAVAIQLNGAFIGQGLTVTTSSNCQIGAPSGQVTNFSCTIGSLPVGGSVPITIDTQTSTAGDVTVYAVAEGANPVPIDPNLDDNQRDLAVSIAEAFSNGAVQILGNAGIRSVAVGDFNNDGVGDLVNGTVAGQPVQVWLSGGFRNFVAAPISIADTAANEGVAVGDFDEDGNLDIVVANGGGATDRVYGGDGNGNFSLMATLTSTDAHGVAVGDFNNDNNLDIAIATTGGNPIFHGNGNGVFSLQRTLGNNDTRGVAVADFNGDGRDDVAFANVGANSVVHNAGLNTTLANLNIGDASSVAVGQFGGNNRPDLVFGRIPGGIGDVASNPVLIANNNGSFGNPVARLGSAPTRGVQAGDVDRDGLDDIVVINASGSHQIYLADGGGGFKLYREQIVADGAVAGALAEFGFADVGEPGGVDLAMGGFPTPGLGVYLNDGFGNLGKGDAVPPVLTLNGETSVDVDQGTAYSEQGATATDNIDGDISGRVVVTPAVNTQLVGPVTLTYNVTDNAGNAATPVQRTVNVVPASGSGGGGGGVLSLWLIAILLLVRVRRAVSAIRGRAAAPPV